jgi:tetratricopeptide (TPR) repeat protein
MVWLLIAFAISALGVAAPGHAQLTGILSQEPSDIITLNEQNQNRVLRTMPLDFPGRRIPANPAPNSRLRVRLLNNPDEEFDVLWGGIAEIELFEQRVLREAQRLIRARKFDDAFEHLSYVQNNYPDTPGLDLSVEALLFAEASALYRERNFERAVLLLNEIYERNPERRNLASALTRVLQALFDSKVNTNDFQEARRVFGIAEKRYGSRLPELLTKWRRTLRASAEEVVAETRSQLKDGDLRSAYASSRKALDIWPDTPGLRELVVETSRRYPLVTVGVMQAYGESNDHPMFNWAQRRTSRLRLRRLFELSGVGPDGSKYICPVGDATVPDDGRSFSVKMVDVEQSSQDFLGMAVSRRLLDVANPTLQDYDPAWAMLLRQVTLASASDLQVDLRRPFLRVQGLLNIAAVGSQNPTVLQGCLPRQHNRVKSLSASLTTHNKRCGPYVVARSICWIASFRRTSHN